MRKLMTLVVWTFAALAFPSWGDPAVRPYETSALHPTSNAQVPAYELEEVLIADTSALSSFEQLALYLGETSVVGGAQMSLKARVRRLFDDPAVASHFKSIRDEWFRGALTYWTDDRPLFRSTRDFIECKVMIARNLFFRGLTPSAESVREEYKRIQRLRRRYGKMEIFSERNVVFAASDDRTKDGYPMFGDTTTVRRLGRKAHSMVFLRKGKGTEKLWETSGRLAENLSTVENLTFVFEGHGRGRKMKFAGGLTPVMVVDNLVRRPSRESDLYVSNPWSVVVINSCQAHTFSRELLDLFRKTYRGRQLPVVIVPVEFGDDLSKSIYNDPFFTSELRLAYRTDTHLGALFSTMKNTTSVYVPDEDNVLTQIG